MEPHRSWIKYHRLGNLIPLCDYLRHYLDMGKATGNQRIIALETHLPVPINALVNI
jgi:hypothetical protein